MKRYVSEMRIDAPIESVWNFYTTLDNLSNLTLPHLHLRVLKAEQPLRKGARITFGVRRGPVPVTWESVIDTYDPPHCFVDRQVSGPFRHWVHRHEFESLEGGTLVRDTIEFGNPRGILGRMAAAVLLDHEIQELFRHRERVVRKSLESV
jgi:ligand-binding SRPBCC domain-containing protein